MGQPLDSVDLSTELARKAINRLRFGLMRRRHVLCFTFAMFAMQTWSVRRGDKAGEEQRTAKALLKQVGEAGCDGGYSPRTDLRAGTKICIPYLVLFAIVQ